MNACPLRKVELDIIYHMSEGKQYSEIAPLVGLTKGTIRNYVHDMLGVTNTLNATHLVAMAIRANWI